MKSALSALGRRTTPPPIAWLMNLTLERPGLISLAAGFTDNQTLPVRTARRLLAQLLAGRRTGVPALQYGSTAGLPELRRLTAERCARLDRPAPGRASESSPDEWVITHGSQQLLYLVTEVLCDPGDVVLLEDPTYFVYLGIAQSHGLRCRGIRLASEGLEVAQLETVLEQLRRAGDLPRTKLLYLVTYHQNPTGTTTRFDRKAAALDLLTRYERWAGHPIYLVEDAAYRELDFAGGNDPSALALPGADRRVIYTGTYSKPFATGVRVGFGRLPEPVRSAVLRVKANHDFGTSSLLQHLLARALQSGSYDQHVQTLRRRYAAKAGWMADAIRRHFPPEVQWRQPQGGMYLWAALPRRVRSGPKSALFRQALDAEVLYVPGQLCYAPDPTRRAPDHELRLSFGNATRVEIEEGIARLGKVVRAALG